jgi:hypothetical protein
VIFLDHFALSVLGAPIEIIDKFMKKKHFFIVE